MLRSTLDSGTATADPSAPSPNVLQDLFYWVIQVDLQDHRALTSALTLLPEKEDVLERLLKAWNPDLYSGNSYIEYYYFYRQCKDHFDTAGANKQEWVSFATSFVKDWALYRWQ